MPSEDEKFFDDDSYDHFLDLLAFGMFDLAERTLDEVMIDYYGSYALQIAHRQLRIARLLEPYLQGKLCMKPLKPSLLDPLIGPVRARFVSLFPPDVRLKADNEERLPEGGDEEPAQNIVPDIPTIFSPQSFEPYIQAAWDHQAPPDLPFGPDISPYIATAVSYWRRWAWTGNKVPLRSGGRIIAITGVIFSRGLGEKVLLTELRAAIDCKPEEFDAALRDLAKPHYWRGLPWKFVRGRESCSIELKPDSMITPDDVQS